MVKRSKKRSAKSEKPVDEDILIKRGASVKAIKTWNDVEHDSDEEFDASRDKVLLGFDKRNSRKADASDNESDQEVFGMAAEQSSGDEAADDSDNGSQTGFYSDEDNEDHKADQEQDDGAWGKEKHNYYDADDYGTDSGDDDAAYAEEAEEALRLQKKQLEALDEDDFIDEFGAQLGVASGKADASVARLVTAVDDSQAQLDLENVALTADGAYDITDAKRQALLNLPESEKVKIIQAESPELLLLVADVKRFWTAIRKEIKPVIDRAMGLGVKSDDHPALAFYMAKYQLLMSYINNVAVYLVVKASTAEERGGIALRDHPVIASIVEFRRRVEIMDALQRKIAPLLDLFAEELRTGKVGTDADDKLREEKAQATASDSDVEMAEAPVDLDEAISRLGKANAKAREKTKAKKGKPSKEQQPTAFLEAHQTGEEDSYSQLQAMLRREKKAQRKKGQTTAAAPGSWDTLEDGDFGEQEHLGADDADDKARAVRRLRHHAKRIAQAQTKRESRGKLSGDTDVPYKSRRNDRQRVDDRAADAIRAQAEQYGDALDADAGMDVDGNSDGDGDYYHEVELSKKNKAAAKEQRQQEQWRDMVSANVATEAAVSNDSKRAVNYQILKNKGLMPRRTKEQRNPRVKRRMRFEQAKKKLSSAVAQVRTLDGNYGGEATGIKSSLSRSTRFK
ncbi:something about silencing protein 10 [Coemansia sp. RSA 1722]|nr:something about silencing protein 10 [Coemansia sp. RSA 485]KAJ2594296.1 something about silencing protein 10 [Coemansia sp. RSA 1722]